MEINEFDENIVSSKRLRRESTGSVHSTITSISSLRTSNNSSVGTLDSFITRPLATRSFTKGEQAIFEKLMIQATVSAEGEVIIWKAVDVSSELERWKEVIEKTETMFKEINKMGVNLISVVTDSAPSYAAAWYICIFF
ncbi:uncharacterized protein OCT59_009109 [Rhizophagus irregularis]|uniref:uncharacterized protein n=1 Tax=Rhizophagus irregularis TaxID=588596 RepID=UPI0033254DE6|nr:hypothetical protein OCT59_009109 [Rhizophagus irregularis]